MDGESVASARAGQDVELVLDRTPFYAEGGGQLADGGRIELDGGAVVEVHDVQSPIKGLIVHRASVLSGEVSTGTAAHALVDIDRRRAISRAHTATHMVHKAIREALGDTATQAGSENAPGRFRFDFNAQSALPVSVLSDVEAKVNALLLEDLPVHAEIMTQQQARDSGAMALFGEKYGDAVRVVSVGDWARELCGGTHAQRSGQLGLVKLLGEASIGSGVRRVEALVGTDAYDFLAREHALVGQLTEALKVRPEELPERIASILGRLKDAEREITTMRQQQVLAQAGALVSGARDVFGVSFIGHDAGTGVGADDLRGLALDLRGRLGNDRPSVVAVAGVAKDRPAGHRGHQRRRPGSGASGPVTWSRSRPRPSAAVAAARTTWPRAAAPTRPRSPRRWRASSTRWASASPQVAEPDAHRRAARGRRGQRPRRPRGQRPLRGARHAGADAAAGPRRRARTSTPSPRPCWSARCSRWSSGLPRSLSGLEGRAAALARDYARRARRTGRPRPGAPGGRAAVDGGCFKDTAGQWCRGSQAARRGGPGGRRAHPPGSTGR